MRAPGRSRSFRWRTGSLIGLSGSLSAVPIIAWAQGMQSRSCKGLSRRLRRKAGGLKSSCISCRPRRSGDGGMTWNERGPVWPELEGVSSLFVGLSRSPSGELFLYGTRTPIDAAGESFWSEDSGGLKQNELVWARSSDSGRSWSRPAVIPMPQAGAAEAPGPMCITRRGRWVACYAPYPTFDPDLRVDRGPLALL